MNISFPGSPTRPKAAGSIGTTGSVATGSARILEAQALHQPDAATTTTPPCPAGWLACWTSASRAERGPRVAGALAGYSLGCPHAGARRGARFCGFASRQRGELRGGFRRTQVSRIRGRGGAAKPKLGSPSAALTQSPPFIQVKLYYSVIAYSG